MILIASSTDAGKRLDAFLHERLPQFSRSRLQSWVKDGRVHIGSNPVRAAYLLKGGEQIDVDPAALPPLQAEAEDLPLKILYQDSDVIVINKPSGMVVHAGAGHSRGTLVNALLHHFGSLSSVSGEMRPGIVHRLDKETSGALVVARTDEAHRSLAAQFESREVEKVYLALVHGNVEPPQGQITLPIARDPVRRTRMTTKLQSGRSALTTYKTRETLGNFTLLEVRIGTGRTHQIRVHMSSLRHVIVGDKTYGAPRAVEGLPPFERFFLHAHRLRFRSPSTGEWVTVESPLPPEFEELLACLRRARDKAAADKMEEVR
ncbi:MAG TPA: RluA family pseudouridine synthase [Bryobacteraceae bacterium]|nr:RluA family pseudouridine synthase [Bryobacteraceae bacterium]